MEHRERLFSGACRVRAPLGGAPRSRATRARSAKASLQHAPHFEESELPCSMAHVGPGEADRASEDH